MSTQHKHDKLKFSVIIPTRDRPSLFKKALESVLGQDYEHFDIHVVNDGSSNDFNDAYKEIEEQNKSRVTFHHLIHRPNGHGQSYSMNYGASLAKCDYLCFLDDDDVWTDKNHLSRASKAIQLQLEGVDLYYTNQKAFFSDGQQNMKNVWIEDLTSIISNQLKDDTGSYHIDYKTLLKSNGFAHLNCSIFNKVFYEKIKGMDENIRYECDRDIYIRSIDTAEYILYNPAFTSRHHIPDQKKSGNMSTVISIYQKKLYQLQVYDKGILLCKKHEIIKFCKTGKGYQLKHITEALNKNFRYKDAFYYAKEALATLPTFKWFLFTISIYFKQIIR